MAQLFNTVNAASTNFKKNYNGSDGNRKAEPGSTRRNLRCEVRQLGIQIN